MKTWVYVLIALAASATAACTVGPDYQRPPAPEPAKYKELKGWKPATPIDEFDRGAWWTVFSDKRLDSLVEQVKVTNQNVISLEAAYRAALALVKLDQAGLFPQVSAQYNPVGSHTGSARSAAGVPATLVSTLLSADATWSLDVWGRIRRQIESDVSTAQFSAADLAAATLSAQATLAANYYRLRAADALQALLYKTAAEYRRNVEITQNKFNSGVVSKADVAAAQAQVYNTEAQAIDVGVARAQYEHAIAALIGRPPADLNIPPNPLAYFIPLIPPGVPSRLLERRPDVAAAERLMQRQNALIGVAVAAYYPDIALTGRYGVLGTGFLPASLGNEAWSLGARALQVAFDGGLRSAQVEGARAAYDQSVADYRQTVLTAFQLVEDQLAAIRLYAQEAKVQAQAVKASEENVTVRLNQYASGTVDFTSVIVAQATLLSDKQRDLAIRQNRFLAAVALIEQLGGGWDVSLLPASEAIEQNNPLIPKL